MRGKVPESERRLHLSSCGTSCDPDEIKAFAAVPLTKLQKLVVHRTRAERELPSLLGKLPFEMGKHPNARTELATTLLRRLDDDVRTYAQQQNHSTMPQLAGFGKQDLHKNAMALGRHANTVETQLSLMRTDDEKRLQALITRALKLANSLDPSASNSLDQLNSELLNPGAGSNERLAFGLARRSGGEVELRFEHLVQLLASAGAEADLRMLNPFLTLEQAEQALDAAALALLTANRVAQLARCLEEARGLVQLVPQLQRAANRAIEQAAVSQADVLASSLVSHRHYMRCDDVAAGYDPRLLLFEFAHGLLLREAQVRLLGLFLQAQGRGESLCHQLIMGQGKTTVIAPLLAIMLADGTRSVVNVVPPHLLPSARAILRERLGTLFQRPVYGMRFDRYTPVREDMLERLRHARSMRGVLLTDPSSLKSLMLKFVESCAILQGEVPDAAADPPQHEFELMMRLRRLLGLRRRRPKLREAAGKKLTQETEMLAAVLDVFRSSCGLLDEVDVLLHARVATEPHATAPPLPSRRRARGSSAHPCVPPLAASALGAQLAAR